MRKEWNRIQPNSIEKKKEKRKKKESRQRKRDIIVM